MKTIRLKQNFYDVFIDALESGDYEQIHGNMKDGDGYCCLGVAGDICGIPSYILEESALPGEIREDIIEEHDYPEELTRNQDLFAFLNDGFYPDAMKVNESIKGFLLPEYIVEKIKNKGDNEVILDFKDIANFIKANVQII